MKKTIDTFKTRRKIKIILMDRGLEAQQVAAEMGIHRSTLYNALNGYRQTKKALEVLNKTVIHLNNQV